MENKRYEAYHILDEEMKNPDQTADISSEEVKSLGQTAEIIDVEAVEQEKSQYTSVLQEEEEVNGQEKKLGDKNSQVAVYQAKRDEKENRAYYSQTHDSQDDETYEEKNFRDTSFSSYVAADKKKEKSFFVKWGVRLAKLILLIMLLPVIGIVGAGVLSVLGGIAMGILACIGGGIFILGATCFVATQVKVAIVALGIAAGITAISFGGIALILCMMLIKKIVQVISKHRKNKKEVR